MSVLPQDETGKAEHGYDYDFGMPRAVVYVDDGVGGVKIWDGSADFIGDVEINTDALEQLVTDSLEHYKLDDFDVSSDPKYVGFQDKAGNYYIARYNIASPAVDYTAGASGYSAAWTNRAAESYADFASTF